MKPQGKAVRGDLVLVTSLVPRGPARTLRIVHATDSVKDEPAPSECSSRRGHWLISDLSLDPTLALITRKVVLLLTRAVRREMSRCELTWGTSCPMIDLRQSACGP